MTPGPLYLGADHAGFALKEALRAALADAGADIRDLSPTLQEGDDYPAPGFAVAKAVAADPSARGILVCGSGVGVAIAANRVPHARAVVAHDEEEAALARRHNDANILALSGRSQAAADALPIIRRFLGTAPDPDERHHRRIRQLDA